jgi:RNA polymerase sigma factor for flagellar operon FliA
MDERQDLQALFVEHLPHIERAVAAVCRRHGVRDADAEDCAGWIRLRIIADEYAAFRKFRGESSIQSYLTVVVAMLFRDWRVQQAGRWRPSAAARRIGAVAMRLERLVRRDGVPLREAGELLRTRGETTLPDGQLGRVVRELPARAPLRPIVDADERVEELAAPAGADARVAAREAEDDRRALNAALAAALARLPAEDQLVLRLRYWEGLTVAEVARALALEQRPLYRRLERLLAALGRALEERGVSAQRVRALLDDLPAE